MLTSPALDPARYPGVVVRRSCLLVGARRYPLTPDWRLGASVPLASALHRLGAAAMAERYPTLCVGSNAAPAQLAHKFGTLGTPQVVPVTMATVAGLRVGFSAHVSAAGYVPYAPMAGGPADTAGFAVLWLDGRQLARLHETEPNYRPVCLADPFAARLESGAVVPRYALYRSRWGVLSADGTALPAGTQVQAYARLARLGWFVRLVPAIRHGPQAAMRALRGDAALRRQVRRAMHRRGANAPDQLDPHVAGRPPAVPPVPAGGLLQAGQRRPRLAP